MAVVRIESFGGEAPSVSVQALPGDLAQRNVNLYAGIREFRPLMEDKDTGVAASGAKTIYRTQRKAGGGYNGVDNETANWRVDTKDLSYVKGQVNDDATERTYFTTNDASIYPKAFDADSSNNPRRLGVPAPASTEASVIAGQTFTTTNATEAVDDIAKSIQDAILESTIDPRDDQKGARYTDFKPSNGVPRAATLVPRAGPKSNYGMGPTEEIQSILPDSYKDMHWLLYAARPLTEMEEIFGKQGIIDLGIIVGSQAAVAISGLPFCLIPDKKDPVSGKLILEVKLRAMINPKDGKPMFTDEQVANMLKVVVDGSRMENRAPDLLDKMDTCVKTFANEVFNTTAASLGKPRDEYLGRPAEPTVPQTTIVYTYDAEGNITSSEQKEAPEWVQYRKDLADYNKWVADREKAFADYAQAQKALVSRVAGLQNEAYNLSAQIESKVLKVWSDEMNNLDNLKRALVDGFGGNDALFGGVDSDAVKESRFYVSTYVTDWGEESAPSPVSKMVEPTQYDTVDVKLAPPPSGRFITGIRIYRSNAASTGAAFQYLGELNAKTVAVASVVDAVKDAVIECTIDPRVDQKGARYTGYTPSNGVPKAARLTPRVGAKSNYFMGPTEEIAGFLPENLKEQHWLLHAVRPLAEMNAIFGEAGVKNQGAIAAGSASFYLHGLPYCLIPDKKDPSNASKTLLEARLRAIKNSKTNQPLFGDKGVTLILEKLIDVSRLEKRSPALVEEMDKCVKDFSDLVFNASASGTSTASQQVMLTRAQDLYKKSIRLSAEIETEVLRIWEEEVTDPAYIKRVLVEALEADASGAVATDEELPTLDNLSAEDLIYPDTKKSAELGEGLATTTWLEPPEKLIGLVGMPNGIMAGFFDNTVCFCEPYAPYAWPVEYQITTEHPIVGLATFGQTLFVGTTGSPYFISGSDSASMSALKMDSNQACVSRRSIVAVQGGVLYASPDGLCLADGRGISVVSQGLFTREDWQALKPETILGAEHEGIYFMSYEGNGGGVFSFDLPSKKLTRLAGVNPSALFVDRLNDVLYYANKTTGKIHRLYGGTVRRSGVWKSGRNPFPQHATLAWAQVEGAQTAADPVLLRLYGDNYFIDERGLVYERTATGWLRRNDGGAFPADHDRTRHTVRITDNKPVRMPFGRWRDHEVEVESRARVTRVTFTGSLEELKSV